ncbi:MAG: Gfo/Idh/MocA family oxidoreductase, partial [Nanoarchaeota archaeon]|nr:Gfo/Idh/MocA family oxidoreductase [Nanoarchaeota archaeon]
MKIAIIGVGYWGNKHVEELNALGITPIICDANKENIKACMEKFKVSHVEDFEQILNDKTIEAVIICLPNELHFEFAKRALESGKHVLVEKPITVKYKDGVHLVDIAEKNG